MADRDSLWRRSLTLTVPAQSLDYRVVVQELVSTIGRRRTAFVAGQLDADILDQWIGGSQPPADSKSPLYCTWKVATAIAKVESPGVARAWLTGLNSVLDDQVPLRLLKDGDGKRVIAAAETFISQG